MKKLSLLISMFLIFLCGTLISQNRIFTIHEDAVKPHSVSAYEEVGKELVAACKKHKVESMRWMSVKTDDHRYLFVTEIPNMAELDKNGFAELTEKMGQKSFGEMMTKFTGYDEHGDYTIQLREDLSYQPSGIDQRTKGQEYRRFNIWHIQPEEMGKATKALEGMKELSTRNGSTLYYRVYENHFGQMGPYFQIAISGVSKVEYITRRDENFAKFGDEGAALMENLNSVTWKLELYDGKVLPELSYSPVK